MPTHGSLQGKHVSSSTSTKDADLPGLQSHVRYSVFKDRRHVERFPRGEKRTGNLAAVVKRVKETFLAEGLFLQRRQYMRAPLRCQAP